jgi:2-methylcitrate dehydratase PrpD
VTVKTGGELIHQYATPVDLKARPKTTVDAQFSLPYSVAVILYFGRALLDEYSHAAFSNSKVQDLASRVHCISDPEIDRRWPREEPSEVTVRLKDGSEYTAAVSHAKGSLADPMAEDELRDKFRMLTDKILTKSAIDWIIDIVANLEKLSDVRELIGHITKGVRDKSPKG